MDLDPGMPEVLCFPGPFNEVILNIIVNAAHAITEKLGESSTEKGVIRITSRAEGDWAVVRISDSGTGIPEAAQAHVFEPFFTTKEVGHGTGQGLSLSHRIIVDNHAGELNFDTLCWRGHNFYRASAAEFRCQLAFLIEVGGMKKHISCLWMTNPMSWPGLDVACARSEQSGRWLFCDWCPVDGPGADRSDPF